MSQSRGNREESARTRNLNRAARRLLSMSLLVPPTGYRTHFATINPAFTVRGKPFAAR